MNPNLPSARRRHFSCPDSTSRAESKLVPVLLRITAEPESAYVRFNALAYYALVSPELILSVLSTPNWISSDQELLLWYGEDLVNFSEKTTMEEQYVLMCMLSLFERKQLFPGVVRLDGKNVMKKRKIKEWKCETCNHRSLDAS